MKVQTLFLGLIFVTFHGAAHAQLFKCKGASGRYSIQNSPCPQDAKLPDVKRPVVGEKDPNFAQQGKDKRPDANWQPRVPFPTAPQPAPMQAEPQPQVNASRQAAASPQAESWKVREQESRKRQADEQDLAAKEQAKARIRQQECNDARQQLSVHKEERPILSRDNKGDKHYVGDDKRPAALAAATQRVANACN